MSLIEALTQKPTPNGLRHKKCILTTFLETLPEEELNAFHSLWNNPAWPTKTLFRRVRREYPDTPSYSTIQRHRDGEGCHYCDLGEPNA